MRKTIGLFVLVLGFVQGCGGGSYCKHSAKLAEDCGEPLSDADLDACEQAMEACSASDEAKLTDFTDCVADSAGGICGDETATDLADAFSVFACFAELEGVSEECLAANGTATITVSGSTTSDPTVQ